MNVEIKKAGNRFTFRLSGLYIREIDLPAVKLRLKAMREIAPRSVRVTKDQLVCDVELGNMPRNKQSKALHAIQAHLVVIASRAHDYGQFHQSGRNQRRQQPTSKGAYGITQKVS